MKKIFALMMSVVMITTCAAVPFQALAATKVKPTSITSVSAGAASFKVKYKKITKITGYQVSYSTSKKFTKKATKTVKVKGYKTTSKTVKGLKSKKKYYVKVRTYKTYKSNGKTKYKYSKYSKAKSITTKKAATSSTSSLSYTPSPVNGITTNLISPAPGKPIPYSTIPGSNAIVIAGTVFEANGISPNYVDGDSRAMYWDGTNGSGSVVSPSLFDYTYALDMAKQAVAQCHLTSDMSDAKKLCIISKWISLKITYNNNSFTNKNTAPYYGQTAYEAFKFGTAVCGGYSEVMQMMCSIAGINCYSVSGMDQGQGHGWNFVQLDGKWYSIDCYGVYYANTKWTTDEINALRGKYVTLIDGTVIEQINGVPSIKGYLSLNGGCRGGKDVSKGAPLYPSSQALWNCLQPKGTMETVNALWEESLNMYEEMHNWQIG